MGNWSISWLILPHIINRILFVWGPMRLCVKPVRPKSRDQGFNLSYIFFLGIVLLFIFASFFKLNIKSKTTMDEHKHKILVTLVFVTVISQAGKIETRSIIEKQAQKLNKKRGKWSFKNKHRSWTRREENEEEVEYIGFGLGFSLILQCGFHQNINILLQATLGPKVANWPPELIDTLFFFVSSRVKSRP